MEPRNFAVTDLQHYHLNARRGNIDAIAESLRVNGQYKPIIVNAGSKTGRENEVLVGNHTLDAMIANGGETIKAVVIDVTDEEARRIVLADNRTSDLGSYDDEMLLDLLMSSEELEGTAFSIEDVEALEALTYSHDDGPRDLDALHKDVGDPTDEDTYVAVKVLLPAELADKFSDRIGDDHAAAIAAMLEAEAL